MRVTNEQFDKIVDDAKFDFFNTDKTFDEVLRNAVVQALEIQVRATVSEAASFGHQFEVGDQE